MTRPTFGLWSPGSFEACGNSAGQSEAAGELRHLAEETRAATAAFDPLGLILTGSLARGESSIVERAGGRMRWLSDIECIAVFPDKLRDFSSVNRALRALELSLNTDAERMERNVRVEVRAITAAKLARMRETIFSRELFENGRLLWGVPERLAMPRWVSQPPAIPALDALRLLANRTVERVEFRLACEACAPDPTTLAYNSAKFWIDLGTSLSIFLGCYRPNYHERASALEERLRGKPQVFDAGAGELFLGRLREAMETKRAAVPDDGHGALASFEDGTSAAKALLAWETDRLITGGVNAEGWRAIPERFRRVESSWQRLRDWARLWLRTRSGGRFATAWPSLMATYGSPTAAIYSAACLLDFFWKESASGDAPGDAICRSLGRLFGVEGPMSAATRRRLARATVSAWIAHVRFNAA